MTLPYVSICVVTLLTTLLWATAPPAASANDSSLGAVAGRLQPLQETRVAMAREDITLTRSATDWNYWSVDARYWFENRSDETVELQMGFPERARCSCYDCDWWAPEFHDMRTWADGRELPHEITMMDVPSIGARDWHPPCQARVFVYELQFAPGQRIQVTHQYQQTSSDKGEASIQLEYVTTTGANWNGPIGEARFTFRSPAVLADDANREFFGAAGAEVFFTTDLGVVGRREFFEDENRMIEVVFAAEEWMPSTNLAVTFFKIPAPRYISDPETYPYAYADCIERGWMQAQWGESYRSSLADRLSVSTDDELRLIRNGPYAAHGYPFESVDLAEHYYVMPWQPRTESYCLEWNQPFVHAVPYMPNPDYSDALLYDVERECIDLIRAEERRRAELRAADVDPIPGQVTEGSGQPVEYIYDYEGE